MRFKNRYVKLSPETIRFCVENIASNNVNNLKVQYTTKQEHIINSLKPLFCLFNYHPFIWRLNAQLQGAVHDIHLIFRGQ